MVYMETVRDITELFVDRETHYRVYRYLLLLVAALGGGLLFLLSTWLTRPIRSLEKVTGPAGRRGLLLPCGDLRRR